MVRFQLNQHEERDIVVYTTCTFRQWFIYVYICTIFHLATRSIQAITSLNIGSITACNASDATVTLSSIITFSL